MEILTTLSAAAPVILPVVTALAGVLTGGFVSRANEKNKRLGELTREIVLEALDNAYEMEDAMSTFVAYAPDGASDPEADISAYEAVTRATTLFREMRRSQGRVAVVGSQRVVDAYSRFDETTHAYLLEVYRQLEDDGIFRGAAAQKFLDNYSDALDQFVGETRKLLGAKGEINPSHRAPLERR